jgi:hypothetical protein
VDIGQKPLAALASVSRIVKTKVMKWNKQRFVNCMHDPYPALGIVRGMELEKKWRPQDNKQLDLLPGYWLPRSLTHANVDLHDDSIRCQCSG